MNSIKHIIIGFLESIIRLNFIIVLKIRVLTIIKRKVRFKNQISVINTYDRGGGAAKIALDLAGKIQIPVKLFVKHKKENQSWVHEIPNKTYSFVEEVLRRHSVQKGWIEFTGFQGLSLLKDSFFTSSSTVHLHNLHGEFLSPAILKSLFKNQKVIWTLHDESFFTGHCSCTLGCEKWEKGCGQCPDLSIYPSVNYDNTAKVLKYKKKWITDLQPTIICPSYWLADRVRIAYPSLKQIEVIPNGIDISVFYPRSKNEVRLELNLPLDKKLVLFVAEFATQNPFKGGHIFRGIIADSIFSDLMFVTVGGKHETEFTNHISYPYISDETELAKLYAACDVLLYPTQADNLPLVVLESMACGTPVIASKLGGIPEVIDNTNGFLIADYKSKIAFKNGLTHYLSLTTSEKNKLNQNAISTIKVRFSLDQMVSSYYRVYAA